MSNFVCSECGMTNIDCGKAGYKTPREIELENKLEEIENIVAKEFCKCLDCMSKGGHITVIGTNKIQKGCNNKECEFYRKYKLVKKIYNKLWKWRKNER